VLVIETGVMEMKFTTFINRKDKDLAGFRSENHSALLKALCCNAFTGYVKEGFNCVLVPTFHKKKLEDMLISQGWNLAA
jgi:hypothetical protein